jgi:hypothetical protein
MSLSVMKKAKARPCKDGQKSGAGDGHDSKKKKPQSLTSDNAGTSKTHDTDKNENQDGQMQSPNTKAETKDWNKWCDEDRTYTAKEIARYKMTNFLSKKLVNVKKDTNVPSNGD